VNLQRIHNEVALARQQFALVELTEDGGLFLKAGLQTSVGRAYVAAIYLTNYPAQMPRVVVTMPALLAHAPHRYRDGNICYLHPNLWNPGRFNLSFVLARTAKWLNKYEVWRTNGSWPGAQMDH
jgi:hypothetical protein